MLRVVARGRIRRPSFPLHPRRRREACIGYRQAHWREKGGYRRTPIYDGMQLGAGTVIEGPAIVQMPETTIVVRPENVGRLDRYGNFVLTVSN